MSNKKSVNALKRSLFVSMLLALGALVIIVGLASRRKAPYGSPSAALTANLLSNSSFENDVDGNSIPDQWTGNSNISNRDGISKKYSVDGKFSVKFVPGDLKQFSQTVSDSWPTGTKFLVKGWSKGVRIPNNQYGEFRITYTYNDGSTSEQIMYVPPGTHDWKQSSGIFIAQLPATKVLVQVRTVPFDRGELYFDALELIASVPETLTPTPAYTTPPPPTWGLSPTPIGDPAIKVLSPNGGEQWQRETSHLISWTGLVPKPVDIYLWKGAQKISTIATNYDGLKYTWTIPSNVYLGIDYRIEVYSLNAKVSDFSDKYFQIVGPSITVYP